jgi:hypothetical protein
VHYTFLPVPQTLQFLGCALSAALLFWFCCSIAYWATLNSGISGSPWQVSHWISTTTLPGHFVVSCEEWHRRNNQDIVLTSEMRQVTGTANWIVLGAVSQRYIHKMCLCQRQASPDSLLFQASVTQLATHQFHIWTLVYLSIARRTV